MAQESFNHLHFFQAMQTQGRDISGGWTIIHTDLKIFLEQGSVTCSRIGYTANVFPIKSVVNPRVTRGTP